MSISEEARALRGTIVAHRRCIHAHPELAFEEHRTQQYVCGQLERLGIPFRRVRTGVIAVLGGEKSRPAVGLRADMDALPLQEETGLPFASCQAGRMHACGHDAHTAMLLGAAELLKGRESQLAGPVCFFFQPAEEIMSGAEILADQPEAKTLGAIFSLHIWSGLPSGTVSLEPGPRMAAADAFTLTVRGKSAHCGTPQYGNDAILAAACVIQSIQHIASRKTNPLDPITVNIGRIQGGSSYNILADQVTMSGTARYFDKGLEKDLPQMIGDAAGAAAASCGCQCEVSFSHRISPVINDPACSKLAIKALERMGGTTEAVPMTPTMISEDFSCFLNQTPGCFGFLGACGGPENAYPHHHPKFSVDESVLCEGAALMTSFVVEAQGAFEK